MSQRSLSRYRVLRYGLRGRGSLAATAGLMQPATTRAIADSANETFPTTVRNAHTEHPLR